MERQQTAEWWRRRGLNPGPKAITGRRYRFSRCFGMSPIGAQRRLRSRSDKLIRRLLSKPTCSRRPSGFDTGPADDGNHGLWTSQVLNCERRFEIIGDYRRYALLTGPAPQDLLLSCSVPPSKAFAPYGLQSMAVSAGASVLSNGARAWGSSGSAR